jgi:ParB family chromosome partitioning protein
LLSSSAVQRKRALGPVLVEGIILLSASRNNASQILRDAAEAYRVDTDAIALKVKQEFAAKDKTKKVSKPAPKPTTKAKNAA